MIYEKCPLYGVKSKKALIRLLKIKNLHLLKQEHIVNMFDPYIEALASGKKRLLEPPVQELKQIQKTIKRLLYFLDFPSHIFSGVKGRSYVGNAQIHAGSKYLFKIDFSAFFPSISRNKVYAFFVDKLHTSPDVAKILTNLTTIDLDRVKNKNTVEINAFLLEKNIKERNHLISGAPTSQILSYLVNEDMFSEMQRIAESNKMLMSVYVDDVFFSSNHRIPRKVTNAIESIVRKNGYTISLSKKKLYTKFYPKRITGVIINKYGEPSIKNSLRVQIMRELAMVKKDTYDMKSRKRLQGLVSAARQVEPHTFNSVWHLAFERNK